MDDITSCVQFERLGSLMIFCLMYLALGYLVIFLVRKFQHISIPKEYKWIIAFSFFISIVFTEVYIGRTSCSLWLDSVLPNLIVDFLLIPFTAIFITIFVSQTQKKVEEKRAREEAFQTIGVQHLELTVKLANWYSALVGVFEEINSEDYHSKKLLQEHTSYKLNELLIEESDLHTGDLSDLKEETMKALSEYIIKYISLLPKDLASMVVELEGIIRTDRYKVQGEKILEIHNYFKEYYISY
ncbi:hypothetical protein CHH58_06465 [Terribacillus saccharophilus]|uniref:hypothetical protein n=1 Tax=Terribacillus saccharophilus TaxID=361277 RepID=UPI000BA695DC|nr:hypothetical protein [Terribacillus saccharophilus]PAF37831.1 hypothetical protein CHH58_06465 [Terribacillus saccharophilus]